MQINYPRLKSVTILNSNQFVVIVYEKIEPEKILSTTFTFCFFSDEVFKNKDYKIVEFCFFSGKSMLLYFNRRCE